MKNLAAWALVAILLFLAFSNTCTVMTSNYKPITISGVDNTPPDMFSLQAREECIPSSTNPQGAYYTTDTGGLCGDQEYVNSISRDYAIVDGIGGSILSG